MTKKQSLIEFPCQFPLKIVGKKTVNLSNELIDIIRKHFPDTPDNDIRYKDSQQGNYLSISVSVYAENQNALDALYKDLTKHPDIKLVL